MSRHAVVKRAKILRSRNHQDWWVKDMIRQLEPVLGAPVIMTRTAGGGFSFDGPSPMVPRFFRVEATA